VAAAAAPGNRVSAMAFVTCHPLLGTPSDLAHLWCETDRHHGRAKPVAFRPPPSRGRGFLPAPVLSPAPCGRGGDRDDAMTATDRHAQTFTIDAAYVEAHVGDLAKSADLSKFIL